MRVVPRSTFFDERGDERGARSSVLEMQLLGTLMIRFSDVSTLSVLCSLEEHIEQLVPMILAMLIP